MRAHNFWAAAFVGIMLSTAAAGASTEQDDDSPRRGWHFYQDPMPAEVAPQAAKANPVPLPGPAAPMRAPQLVEFEFIQKHLEELRNIAIVEPSEPNVQRYMEFERMVVLKASRFADVAQRVAWRVPDLDPTANGRPVNTSAREVYDNQQQAERTARLAALAHDHVLMFFFRSDCGYCHTLAPTVKAFEGRYGIKVVPISLDGGGLPDYPDPRRDNGIATNLKVQGTPALFLAQPYTGIIAPLGVGVLSLSQLIERVIVVADDKNNPAMPTRPINVAQAHR